MLEEWTVVVGALISYWAPRGELCSFRTNCLAAASAKTILSDVS